LLRAVAAYTVDQHSHPTIAVQLELPLVSVRAALALAPDESSCHNCDGAIEEKALDGNV